MRQTLKPLKIPISTNLAKTTQRVEWRGDLFASDLPAFLDRLPEARVVPYKLSHTLTIFLREAGTEFDLNGTLRVRSYCDLADLEPESIRRAIAEGLSAKLQVKAMRGETTELINGQVVLLHAGAERARAVWGRLQLADSSFEPASVRVARRVHYELPQSQPGTPLTRVTVDLERRLFRVADGTLRPLGEMGPRVEVKAAEYRDVGRVFKLLNPDHVLRRLRYGSLELLFQDMLRDVVRPVAAIVKPEIELKFQLAPVKVTAAAAAVTRWLNCHPETRLLLPVPHQIVRMRRYHFCDGDDDRAQCTIVETAAGQLSAKVKRDETGEGLAIVRATQASHSTNLDGVKEPVEVFARRHGWRRFNTMTKVQAKIPFALGNGHAYLISVDDCLDIHGTPLRQLELEYIGSLTEAAPPTNEVCAELESLAVRLRMGLPRLSLQPTMESKFGFYRRHSGS